MTGLKQIRFAGFGGQGVVLAGTILGYAAIHDGKWVSGSNSYGAQARGGSARSEVVISEEPITFPHVIRSDILIVLSQSAYDAHITDVAEDGALVIYDDLIVEPHGQEPVAPMLRRNPPKLQSSFAKASEDTRIPPRAGAHGFLRRRVMVS